MAGLQTTLRAFFVAGCVPCACAQPKAFDVASVKANKNGRRPTGINPFSFTPSTFTATNATLEELIVLSYSTRRIQIRGGPSLIDSDGFDVVAKTGSSGIAGAQMLPMIRALLKERFLLELHAETEEQTVYALLPGKTPRVQKAKDDDTAGFQASATTMSFAKIRMAGLVNTLSNLLHTPVIDRTGMEGFFTFTLDLSQQGGDLSSSPNAYADAMVDAVRDQLGLRLEKQKAPVEMTVIDRAEKPTAN